MVLMEIACRESTTRDDPKQPCCPDPRHKSGTTRSAGTGWRAHSPPGALQYSAQESCGAQLQRASTERGPIRLSGLLNSALGFSVEGLYEAAFRYVYA